jgi:hypothetical protein
MKAKIIEAGLYTAMTVVVLIVIYLFGMLR